MITAFASSSGVDLLLIAISLIIILGYVGEAIFKATRLPEVLILILIGIALGPIGHVLPSTYVSTLRSLTPLFGSVALIMIMFNSGKLVKFSSKRTPGAYGILIGLADIIIMSAAMALIMHYMLAWPYIYGALLGAILGETTTIAVLPLLRKLKVDEWFYNMELSEATFNSVFSILAFYALLGVIQGNGFSAASYIQYMVSYISIAVFIGLVAGFGWLLARSALRIATGYLASFAVAILLYAFVDLLGGAAVVAVLLFAIIVGNARMINRFLNLRNIGDGENSRDVERNLEFLLRTFFFVFVGIITLLSLEYFIYGLVITAVLIFLRYGQVKTMLRKAESKYRDLLLALLPRGLTVAVLSSILFSLGGTYPTDIFYISSSVIILTNIAFAVLASRQTKVFGTN